MSGLGVVSSACSLVAPMAGHPRIPRIGYLTSGPREVRADRIDAFLEGLRELGYVETQSIDIEWRFTRDAGDRAFSELAADLVRGGVDVIVTEGSAAATQAAMGATSAIPILAINVTLPVETGLVASLGRPGGNVTAVAALVRGVEAKRVELLRVTVPGLVHLVSLTDPGNPAITALWEEVRDTAEALGLQTARVDVRSPTELAAAFETATVRQAQAMMHQAGGLLLPVREQVAALALQDRLPASDINPLYTEAGLLMSYGPSGGPVTQSHRAAVYVDRLLKGARPADLPVDQPTKFDFAINTRTATMLGITIPPAVAAQVTRWVD
jgi:putative ABC transport system substrate-binding protein